MRASLIVLKEHVEVDATPDEGTKKPIKCKGNGPGTEGSLQEGTAVGKFCDLLH